MKVNLFAIALAAALAPAVPIAASAADAPADALQHLSAQGTRLEIVDPRTGDIVAELRNDATTPGYVRVIGSSRVTTRSLVAPAPGTAHWSGLPYASGFPGASAFAPFGQNPGADQARADFDAQFGIIRTP